jgi:hypothetical protein
MLYADHCSYLEGIAYFRSGSIIITVRIISQAFLNPL